MELRFDDRRAAGRRLAVEIAPMDLRHPLVLGLPRGGVPVAYEVAVALDAPLDVIVARKVGAPGHPELGIGAIAEGGARVARPEALARFRVASDAFERLADREVPELERRVVRYRGGRPLPTVSGRDVVVVDDGLATGVTALAALLALRSRAPASLVMAAPVCAADSRDRLRAVADDVVCPYLPADFAAVGDWYADFTQTSDDEVLELLADAARRPDLG